MQEQELLSQLPRLRPIAQHIGQQFFGNAEDAADVAQETCLRLWALRSRIDAGRPIEALTTRMAKNVCVTMWRERQKERRMRAEERGRIQRSGGHDDPGAASMEADPQTLLEERENAVWLEHRLRALPEYLRRVLRMRLEEGMTAAEIAAVIGTDARSVQTLISKARNQILNDYKRHTRNERK